MFFSKHIKSHILILLFLISRAFNLKPIYFSRAFLLLWISMFVSMGGTFLLLLALSAKLYISVKSGFWAGGVFAAQWVPAFLLFPLIGYISNRYSPKKILPFSEIFSGIVSLIISFSFQLPLFLLILLFIRGFLEALMKSSRAVALRIYVDKENVKQAFSAFMVAFFLGVGSGSLAGTILMDTMSIEKIAIIDAITFLISAICYFFLPKATQKTEKKNYEKSNFLKIWYRSFYEIRKNISIKINFYYLFVVVVCFQSYHYIARTVIPISIFKTDTSGVAKYQFAACLGLFFGAYFVTVYFHDKYNKFLHPFSLVIANSIAVILTVQISSIEIGLITYGIFMFLFELTMTKLTNEIMYHCPKELIGLINSFTTSIMMAGMAIIVFCGGKLSDYIGINNLSYLIIGLGFFVSVLIYFIEKKESYVYGK